MLAKTAKHWKKADMNPARNILRASAALILASALLTAAISNAAEQVSPIGSYRSMRLTDEHCDGYEIRLWRFENTALGILNYCAGLVDTRAFGSLEDAKFDPATGELEFSARLTVGMDYLVGGETPSKDFWTFRGKLGGGKLSGTLVKVDKNYPTRPPQQTRLSLKQSNDKLKSFQSREDWQRATAAESSGNGPKW
jgi:hypothetical protein